MSRSSTGVTLGTTIAQGRHANKLILIADDYDHLAELIADNFQAFSPHEAVYAMDGAEALKCATGRRPDVCLFDIEMPNVDGIEAARRMRALFKDDAPIIIGMSGRAWDEAEKSGLFDLFLPKPLNVESVLDFIDPPGLTPP